MDRVPSFDAIEYLVRRKFFRIRSWAPRLHPMYPSHLVIDCELPNENESIAAYRAELAEKTPAEIHELVRADIKKQQDELEEGRFFNQPSARADFAHWCKAPTWTLDECVALSFGKDPKRVSWGRVQPLVQFSPFAQSYQKRRDLTLRALWSKQLSDPVCPSLYLAWAKQRNIPLPDELLNIAVDSGISLEGPAETIPTASEEPLGTKERDSLLKLVSGMAVVGYKFDPRQLRNHATAEICDDIRKLGLSIDEGTVLKYLRQATESLSADVLEDLFGNPNSGKP